MNVCVNIVIITRIDGDCYLDIETWDDYNDDIAHRREYINYCPWCGRRLKEDN